MVGPETVDDYITSQAYPIASNQNIQQAVDKMKQLNTDFLIVTEAGSPVYVLRETYITFANPKDTISDFVAKGGTIDPAVIVEKGTSWTSAIPRLRENTLLVVVDKSASPPRLQGAICMYDIGSKIDQRPHEKAWKSY